MTNNSSSSKLKPVDIFVGLTEDTVSSLVYKLAKENSHEAILNNENYTNDEEASQHCEQSLIDSVQEYLLQSCSSDGIIRLLNSSSITAAKPGGSKNEPFIDINSIIDVYFNQQTHENFGSFFQEHCCRNMASNFIQITTHSRLLSRSDIDHLRSIPSQEHQALTCRIESLLSFDTQQQFIQVLKEFYEANAENGSDKNVLIVQCDCAHFYQDLINCARFTIIDEFSKHTLLNTNFSIILVVQIPKIAGGCISGFQTTKWLCYHIDDLQSSFLIDNILALKDKSLSEILAAGCSSAAAEPNAKSYMFLLSLLRSAVFNSCSKIIDSPSNATSNRSIERIDILLKLLDLRSVSDFGLVARSFCTALMKHLWRLQAERESLLSTPARSKNWIFNDASKISNVIKYGTLKNSCINYIETRLSSLFSGTIILATKNKIWFLAKKKCWTSILIYLVS